MLWDIRYPVYKQIRTKTTARPLAISDEMTQTIAARIHQLMTTNRPYLHTTYTLHQLARDIDVPYYQVSHYLNQKLGLRFTDYINQFRIEYFKELVALGYLQELTMTGIAARCGFNNRNTLTTSFKKFTGRTPAAFIKDQRFS